MFPGRASIIIITISALASFSDGASASEKTSIARESRQLFSKAMKQTRSGNFNQAQALFNELLTVEPSWGLAHLQLGILQFTENPHDPRGMQHLQKAISLAPSNPRAHFQLAIAYQFNGRLPRAVGQFDAAIALRPGWTDALFNRALCLQALEETELAITALEEVTRRKRNHVGAWNVLADLYEDTGNLQNAEAALKKIISLQSRVAYHRYRLGQFYDRLGKATAAQRAFEEAELISPQRQRAMRPLRKSSDVPR